MKKHGLPRTMFKRLSEDCKRTGRGHSKIEADQVLLEVYEQLNAEHEGRTGEKLSVRAFLRLWTIDTHMGSGLSRARAESLVDNPSEADRVRFEQSRRTLSTRLSKARKRRRLKRAAKT